MGSTLRATLLWRLLCWPAVQGEKGNRGTHRACIGMSVSRPWWQLAQRSGCVTCCTTCQKQVHAVLVLPLHGLLLSIWSLA